MKTVAIDLDGVIHAYSKGYNDGTLYDPPMPGVYEALKEIEDAHLDIVIYTARTNIPDVKAWLKQWHLPPYEVTNTKPTAIAYIDDRAIRFVNWRQTLIELLPKYQAFKDDLEEYQHYNIKPFLRFMQPELEKKVRENNQKWQKELSELVKNKMIPQWVLDSLVRKMEREV